MTSPTTPADLECLRLLNKPLLLHGVEDAALHRFQPVAHVGQRPVDNHGHGVVDKARFDFVGNLYWNDFALVQGEPPLGCCNVLRLSRKKGEHSQ